MRVLLTSAGLETEEIKEYFVKMLGKDVSEVKALFIPTAAIDAGAIEVLPKCMNDLLKCGIPNKNIKVLDLHTGMEIAELKTIKTAKSRITASTASIIKKFPFSSNMNGNYPSKLIKKVESHWKELNLDLQVTLKEQLI